jgi:hypothetical protein
LTDTRVVIDSDAVDVEDDGFTEVIDPFPTLTVISGNDRPLSDGDVIDAAIVENDDGGEAPGMPPVSGASPRSRSRISNLHSGPNWQRNGGAREATTKPPSLDEWTTFFGKVVLRATCTWYIQYAFRGIDEEALTDREVERLALSDDERNMIAVPLAELSTKSKFMRKHGRTIVATGDTFNALIVLGMWMSRVNRIASKYRPKVHKARMNGGNPNGSSRSGTPSPDGSTVEGTTGGRVSNGYPIYNPGGS